MLKKICILLFLCGTINQSCKKDSKSLGNLEITFKEKVKDSMFPCSFWFDGTELHLHSTVGFDEYYWSFGILRNGQETKTNRNVYVVTGGQSSSSVELVIFNDVKCRALVNSKEYVYETKLNSFYHSDSSLLQGLFSDSFGNLILDIKLNNPRSIKFSNLQSSILDSKRVNSYSNLVVGSHGIFFNLDIEFQDGNGQSCPTYVYTNDGQSYFLSVHFYSSRVKKNITKIIKITKN
jgi:hypothetical protein